MFDKDKNRCNRKCPLFNHKEACKKITPDMNCYQCIFSRVMILDSDNRKLREKIRNLWLENDKLRLALSDKVMIQVIANPDLVESPEVSDKEVIIDTRLE